MARASPGARARDRAQGANSEGPSALGPPGSASQHVGMPPIDLASVLLFCAGLLIAITLAVLAGTISARVFFDATRGPAEEEPRR